MSECLGSSQNLGINAPLKTNIFISIHIPWKMNAWKMTFLLEKSVFTGHSFIFRGFSASTFCSKIRLSLSPGTLGRTKTRGSGVLPKQDRVVLVKPTVVELKKMVRFSDSLGRLSQGPMFFFSKKMGGRHRTEVFGRWKQDWGPESFEGTCSFTYKTTPRWEEALPKTR